MSFDMPLFLTAFLPVFLILYAAIPNTTARKVLILLGSLLFCAFGSITGMLVLLVWSLAVYALGLLLCHVRSRVLLELAVAGNLAFLFFYKYLNFFLSELCGLPPVTGIAVPLGVSFFTFKGISYLVDLWRGEQTKPDSILDFLLYISFFPQITAGPITRFRDFAPQLGTLSLDFSGLRRFAVGLGKKLLLAYPMGQVADGVFGGSMMSTPLAWAGAAAYMLQIYFDFSGYSDMAIGMGELLGVHTPENFRYPYLAYSIGDFWRRWHLSLSHWFRDYLYIPLGGNRKGKARTAFNKAVVFTLCGFWHGANWTYLCWGLWHGFFSALEVYLPIDRLRKNALGKVLTHAYALMAVMLGFVLFRAGSLVQAWEVMGALFGIGTCSLGAGTFFRALIGRKEIFLFGLCVLCCFPLGPKLKDKMPDWVLWILTLLLLALCLCAMAANGFQPFIYAQF